MSQITPDPNLRAGYLGRIALVTGASGFLGQHLVSALDHAGAEVHCLALPGDDDTPGAARTHFVDLRNETDTRESIARIQPWVVFHLAGVVDTSTTLAHIPLTLHGNLVATVNVLMGALDAEAGRTVITGSSEELHGCSGGCSPYSASKLALRPYVDLFRFRYGLDVVHVRPFMAYGPGQPAHRLVPQTILGMLRGERPRIRQPDRVCDFVYVSDVIDGMMAAALAPDPVAGSFDLGTGVGTSIRDMCATLGELIPGSPTVEFDEASVRVEPHVAFVDGDRLPGWSTAVDLREGLTRTVDWYSQRIAEAKDGGAS